MIWVGPLCSYVWFQFLLYPHCHVHAAFKPGDTLGGVEGEFTRYIHTFMQPPTEQDRADGLKMAQDIRCEACQEIVTQCVRRAESKSEDHIMDQLEGEINLEDLPEPNENTTQADRVARNRRGCNKHYKDDLLLRGFGVRRCADESVDVDADADSEPVTSSSKMFCMEHGKPLSVGESNTYNIRNEAAFYACESTVGRFGTEMAASVADALQDGVELETAVKTVCLEVAKCQGVKKGARKAKGPTKFKEKKKKTKRQIEEEQEEL